MGLEAWGCTRKISGKTKKRLDEQGPTMMTTESLPTARSLSELFTNFTKEMEISNVSLELSPMDYMPMAVTLLKK